MSATASDGQRWAAELAAWAIDPEILEAAPESPYTLPPELFAPSQRSESSPLLDVARAALDGGTSVLDVGAGAGAASLPLCPPAARLVAVDSQASMIERLEREAAERAVPLTTYHGVWPDVAPHVPVCDVVVCSHVFYNVPDLPSFVTELTAHAHRRVVAELLSTHPWVDIGPLGEHFHHQGRPSGPDAELAEGVLREIGLQPRLRRWLRPQPEQAVSLHPDYVAFTRRRLCLPVEREPEVAELLARRPMRPRESVVLWWDV